MMMEKTLPLFSGALSLACDALALQALFGHGYWPAHPARETLAFHGAALVFGVVVFFEWFPPSYRQARITSMALYLGFCGPLPLAGSLALITFRLLLRLRPSAHPEKNYIFGDRQVLALARFGEAAQSSKSVLDVLSGRGNEVRRNAILALRSVDAKKSLPVLQKAIQDSDEQVRLLEQTQFNKIIAGLELMIKKMETELTASPRSADKLVQLAEQYHELVYLGLSSEETETIYLERAVELLREALTLAPENEAARFLLLKCFVKSENLPAARDCLQRLKDSGFQPEFLAAWESEIHFQARDWESLERTLKVMQNRKATDPRLRNLMEFWLGPTPTE